MKNSILVMLVFLFIAPFVNAQNERPEGINGGRTRDILPVLPSHDKTNDQPAYLPTVVTQTITLSAGWNWFSTYIEMDPVDLLNAMETSLGENGLEIKYKNTVTAWDADDEDWSGGLQNIGLSNGSTYMVRTSAACTVTLEGPVANPADYQITLNPKAWTWIGFPCGVEVDTNVALAGFEAMDGDQIKSRSRASAWDSDEEEWSGGVTKLVPGTGYMFYSNSTAVRTLVFSAN